MNKKATLMRKVSAVLLCIDHLSHFSRKLFYEQINDAKRKFGDQAG